MKPKHKKALLQAAEFISNKQCDGLCNALSHSDFYVYLEDIPEANMIAPLGVTDFMYWWGTVTMNKAHNSEECRNARLLGIAMMITMPEDMVDYSLTEE